MKVKTVMNSEVIACRPTDGLQEAARIMWDRDAGIVPVVEDVKDEGRRLVGIVTDRDLCMAALLSGRDLSSIKVADAMSREVRTVAAEESLKEAHLLLRSAKVRRLPVVDGEGNLVGVLSLGDLIREAYAGRGAAATQRQREVGKTIAAVSELRA